MPSQAGDSVEITTSGETLRSNTPGTRVAIAARRGRRRRGEQDHDVRSASGDDDLQVSMMQQVPPADMAVGTRSSDRTVGTGGDEMFHHADRRGFTRIRDAGLVTDPDHMNPLRCEPVGIVH